MATPLPHDGPTAPLEAGMNPQAGSKELFYRYFQEEATSLQDQIVQLQELGLSGGERQDGIDHCLAGIARLSREAADASTYIPAYDQRTCSDAIKALAEKLEETRAKITPRPKFSFKSSQKHGFAISLTDAADQARAQHLQSPNATDDHRSSTTSSMKTTPAAPITPPNESDVLGELPSFKNYNAELSRARAGAPIRKPSFSQATNILISGHKGLHIILPSSASRATSAGSLTKLDECIVDMSVPTANGAPFAGLALKDIKGSLIVAGQVAGAAHITGVENSVIAVSSRQVRMHDCKNVDIYLLCVSRPIIEDCSNVRFAPIPACYVMSSEAPATNQWDQVDDFKWLKAEHSPNWSVIPDSERVREDIWTGVVPGGPSTNVNDILRKVGVKF
ncbi:MAG: hypothetical protein M1818_003181 [Claussenomyces sp. TS43310]|nr:MAG: hypothetical protein M1818_003181 [Claussenomyces sp. TS43310]